MSGDSPDGAGPSSPVRVPPDPAQWSRIVELFHAVLDRPETERDAFLRDTCGSDALLYRELTSMLAADAAASRAGLEDLVPRVAVSWASDGHETSLVGQRLGRYRIVAHLGSGGMGDVYRATDDGLGRNVALKVLRPPLLSQTGVRGRLEVEARAASALNHPNIVTVYETGHDGGLDFIASELVDGDTLGARLLHHGALSLRELIDIAIQVAAALSAAHAAGIVHRDIKPDNVMLRPDGLVKVVDFGLAKVAMARDAGSRASDDSRTSQPGTVAGTLSYMSPEQALGERLDHRTDLFSLGIVLYEMATGRRPFEGASEAGHYDMLLHASPPAPSSLRPKLPIQLDLVIGRTLEKDRELRYQSAADLAADLKRLQRPSVSGERPALLARAPSSRLWKLATAVSLAMSGVLVALLWSGRTPTVTSDARFTIGPAPQTAFTLSGTIVPSMTVTISPDGRRLVYLAGARGERPRLWTRLLASLDTVPLVGTEDASYPFWSPDSQSLGFFADGALKRLELNDGTIRTLATGTDGRGATWGANGLILFGTAEGPVYRVMSAGGAASPVTALDRAQGEVWHRFPQLLPDGKHFLYLVRAANGRRVLYASSLDGRSRTQVIETDVRAAYAAPGFLLYMSEGALMARPFDPARLQLSGEPTQVAAGVATSSAQDAAFAASDTGVLTYAPRTRVPGRLTWLDRAGRPIDVVGEVEDYLGMRRSPDGRTIAITRVDSSENAPDLWLLDVARGVSSRFTFDPWIDIAPAWSPDGSSLVFASSRLGRFHLFRRSTAGGPEETLLFQSQFSKYPDDWSPDGQYIVYTTDPRPGAYDLAMLRVADLQVASLLATPFREMQGRISPDGRWLAYTSDETGRAEVHLRAFPSGTAHMQISSAGGSEPLWRGDGRELFYLANDGRLMAVDVRAAGPRLEPGPPRALFETNVPAYGVPYLTSYVATADGQRFLFNMPAGDPTPPAITVMLHWNAPRSR